FGMWKYGWSRYGSNPSRANRPPLATNWCSSWLYGCDSARTLVIRLSPTKAASGHSHGCVRAATSTPGRSTDRIASGTAATPRLLEPAPGLIEDDRTGGVVVLVMRVEWV